MTHTPRYETLQDYLSVVRANRLLILLTALAFAAAGLGLSLLQEPTYVAQSSISFESSSAEGELLGDRGQPAGSAVRSTDALERVRSPMTTTQVKKALRSRRSVGALRSQVAGRVEQSTGVLIVEARGPAKNFVAPLANETARQVATGIARAERRRYATIARSLARQARKLPNNFARGSLQERLARFETLKRFAQPAQVSRIAETPSSPASPKPVRTALLGLLLGLTVGLLAAFVRDVLDRRLRDPLEIEEHLQLTPLGHVREDALGRSLGARNGREALSDVDLEAFRILRANLDLLHIDEPLRTVAVTSALPEEGKTTVASILAAMSVAAGKSVILLECDLRRPTLHQRLAVRRTPGLTDHLAGRADRGEVLQKVRPATHKRSSRGSNPNEPNDDQPRLACITAGDPVPNPAELLMSRRFRDLLRELREAYELVVVDTSPLLSVADTREIIPLVDAVLLCVRASRTNKNQATAAKQALDRLPPRPTAVVVTGVPGGHEADYGYYSYTNPYG